MSYFLVDDGFFAHPKVQETPDAALGLWVRAASWSAGQLTDGHVPPKVLTRLGDRTHYKVHRNAQILVERGLWEPLPEGRGFQFHDWTDYQPRLREDVLRRREIDRTRQRAHRLRLLQGGGDAAAGNDGDEFVDPRYGIYGPPKANQDQIPEASS